MRKIIVSVMFGILFLTLALATIDYSKSDSVAQAPPNEIDVTQALANGNGEAITQAQWAYEDNLEKVDNLALYSEAQMALGEKHKINVDLNFGETTYDHGKITNGEITLDLNHPQYKGTVIKALKEGGFSISKGSSEGKLEYEGNEIDFGESTGQVDVKSNGEIILPKGATMKDETSNTITAIQDGFTVKKEKSTTIINGVGKVETSYGVWYIGAGEGTGELTLNQKSEPIARRNTLLFTVDSSFQSDTLSVTSSKNIILDEDMQKFSISLTDEEPLRSKSIPETSGEMAQIFDPDVAELLSWQAYTERNLLTDVGGNKGILIFSKGTDGSNLIPMFAGGLASSTEVDAQGSQFKIPSPFLEGTSAGVTGGHVSTPFGKGLGVAYAFGEEEKITFATDRFLKPSFAFKKSVGEIVVAEFTVHQDAAWVSIGVPMLQ